MPYLNAYWHDAFFSYAHGPKPGLLSARDDDLLGQWSRQLQRDLTNAAAVKLETKERVRQPLFWMDPELQEDQPVSETLKQKVERSALLIVIMSPYYLQSEHCRNELKWFTEAHPGDARHRIFVVRALVTHHSSWPQELKDCDTHGYSFLPADDEQADPFGYPHRTNADKAYWNAVTHLASHVAKKIKLFAEDRQGLASEPAPQTLFLGFMSETLQDERAELRRRLTDLGFRVVPPTELEDPVDEGTLRAALTTYLRRSTALVLAANEYPGLWPKGQDGGPVGYQIQEATGAKVPCYLWLRVDDITAIKKVEYRQFVTALSRQADAAGIVVQHKTVDEFVTHIRQSASAKAQPDTGVEQLAVICSNYPEDRDIGHSFRTAVREAVQDTRREIFIFDFGNSQEQVKLRQLGERIRDADTVLVLCFDQEWDWARRLIKEISGLGDLRAGRKAKLLVAGPRDRDAGLYDGSVFGFKTVNGLHVDATELGQMLKQEILTAAPAESGQVPVFGSIT
jgi:hypothetical protein